LLKKIDDKEIKVGVIGLGYVGLPLAVEKAKAGFVTKGFDIQQEKVDMVNAGRNYVGDVVDDDLSELVAKGMLSATSDFSFVRGHGLYSHLCTHAFGCSTSSRISAM
jgi:UDP-N-acetyl-D-glucosamine dehydrogenase